MVADVPAPMVPAECDLRGMEWLPLYGGRLFGSDFDAHASDAEFRAGIQLWWAAWNQLPAASLPDDDVALCRLSGLGRDLKAWKKIKPRALHGFVLCADGRLYHRALAAFACESWARRLKDRERKAKWREDRERKKGGDGTRPETGTGRGQDTGQNAEQGCDGTADKIRRDATRRDETRRDATSIKDSSSASATREDVAFNAWNEAAKEFGWREAEFITSTRRYRLATMLDQFGGMDGWAKALRKASAAQFFREDSGEWHGWFSLDWLLDGDHMAKLLEGAYDARRKAPQGKDGSKDEHWNDRRIRLGLEALRQ